MKLNELKNALSQHPKHTLRFLLPTGSKVPPHAHVTEVARMDKKFVDCGGTFRTESTARLQTWFADDTAHRLNASKLLKILNLGAKVLESDELDVEVEYEAPFISQFPIVGVEVDGDALFLRLGTKHTACLAEDKCGVAPTGAQSISFKPLPALPKAKCCG